MKRIGVFRKVLLVKKWGLYMSIVLLVLLSSCKEIEKPQNKPMKFNVPEAYLEEADSIPSFWITTIDEVNDFITNNVRKGTYSTIGTSAGGHPIQAVFYGSPREGTGTTTYSGSLSVNDIGAYRGNDNEKTVYLGIAGVHGFELEGIMGMINLISVLEKGQDLNGTEWPAITAMLDSLDRIILVPLVNPDGRARVPIRMESHKGHAPDAFLVHEYLNTGGKEGGKIIGWPDVKEFIPMDFSKFEFPGGYPNENGVNIMHDDFFGKVQPETRMLFDLTAKEKPDLIMNMHTGVHRDNYFMRMFPPDCEATLIPVWETLYTSVHTALTLNGLQKNDDLQMQADPNMLAAGGYVNSKLSYNLNTALNFHCGALCVVIENASHGYSGIYDNGEPVLQTPAKLLKSELTAHQESMRFLYSTGGRAKWNITFNK